MAYLRIKELCKQKGITLISLAEAIDVARPTMSNFVSGKTKPSMDTLEKLAEALGVDIAELFRPQEADICCPHCGGKLELKKIENSTPC